MDDAQAEAIEIQLKRIADALDRAHPKPSDLDFGQRLTEPHMVAPQHPGRIAERRGDITKWGEGDWILENEDHTGEETE